MFPLFPCGRRATFRHLRAGRRYRFGSCSQCCAILWFEFFFAFLQKLYIQNIYGGYSVTSVIRTNERRLNSEPYVCSTAFGRATLGASDVPNKLFLAFLFSDPDVGVLFSKDVGLIRSSMACCKCGFQMSLCVDTNRKDGYQWPCWRITSASACLASTSIRARFMVSTENCMKVMFLTYDVVRSYEHDGEDVAVCEGTPLSLQPDGGLHLSPGPRYRVIQEESALLWDMIVCVILSKKVHTNMGPILYGYGVMTAWN